MYNNVNVNVSGPGQNNVYKTKVLRYDKSLVSQIVDENTKYVVKYNFDLEGGTITMPEGCLIEFDGGSINNGTLKSNDTDIIGNVKGNALYGVYYLNGTALSHNYKKRIPLQYGVDYGWFRNKTSTPSYNNTLMSNGFVGGIAADENYLYVLTQQSNDAYCLLFDKTYNFLGKSHITIPMHANTCVVANGYMYMYRCYSIPTSTLVYNCINGLDSTPDYNPDLYGGGSIDYDYDRDEFYFRSDNNILIYDKDFNLKETLSDVMPNLAAYFKPLGFEDKTTGDRTLLYQDFIVKNGVLSYFLTLKGSGGGTQASACIATIDLATQKVVGYEVLISPIQGFESEGITKDPVTNDIYISVNAAEDNVSSFGLLGKLSVEEPVNTISSYYNTNNGYVQFYVDTEYTGISLGNRMKPLKTLDSAILVGMFLTDEIKICLHCSENVYKIYGYPTLENLNFSLLEFTYPNEVTEYTKAKVEGPLVFNNCYIRFRNIENVTNNYICRPKYSTITLDGCLFHSKGVRTDNSNIVANNCIFDTNNSIAFYPIDSEVLCNGCSFAAMSIINENSKNFKLIGNFLLNNTFTNGSSINPVLPESSKVYCAADNQTELDKICRVIDKLDLALGIVILHITHTITITENSKNFVILDGYYMFSNYTFKSLDGRGSLNGLQSRTTNNLDIGKDYYFLTFPGCVFRYDEKLCISIAANRNDKSAYDVEQSVDFYGNPIDLRYRGSRSARPALRGMKVGTRYFDTTIGRSVYAQSVVTTGSGTEQDPYATTVVWKEYDGAAADVARTALSSARPSAGDIYKGFMLFDATLRKPIWARSVDNNTVNWKESDGANASVKRNGTKAERPIGSDIYVGFQYMQVDTTYGTYPIWASVISGDTVTWVKADGTDPDA